MPPHIYEDEMLKSFVWALPAALLVLLTDTGARLAEITGLEARDVDQDKAILHLRPNDHRGLKTKTSTRSIPLSPRATECLRQQQVGLSDTNPIFPAYAPTPVAATTPPQC